MEDNSMTNMLMTNIDRVVYFWYNIKNFERRKRMKQEEKSRITYEKILKAALAEFGAKAMIMHP